MAKKIPNTFTHTGVCARNGEYKVIYTSNPKYPNILQRDGYEDITFIPIVNPENESFPGAKDDCIDALLNMKFTNDKAIKAIQAEALRLEFIL